MNIVDISAKLKEIFNYNSDREVQNLGSLFCRELIKTLIDLNFANYRVKCSSYLKELIYIFNTIFRLINCLIDLTLEINVMSNELISGFLFYRSSVKLFLGGVAFKKRPIQSVLCILHPSSNTINFFWINF